MLALHCPLAPKAAKVSKAWCGTGWSDTFALKGNWARLRDQNQIPQKTISKFKKNILNQEKGATQPAISEAEVTDICPLPTKSSSLFIVADSLSSSSRRFFLAGSSFGDMWLEHAPV
jgi:hypothetical protein